jgi:hypothetical protein
LANNYPRIGFMGSYRAFLLDSFPRREIEIRAYLIQGYIGLAVVDEKQQIIVFAEAHGEGQESQLLKPTTHLPWESRLRGLTYRGVTV